MRILVDADACPVKQIVVRLAKERGIFVMKMMSDLRLRFAGCCEY